MILISFLNLAIGYIALFIYIKKAKLWIWVLGISFQMRVLLSLYQVIFNKDDFDIVTGTSRFTISPLLIYIISLIFGLICFILFFKYFKYENERKDFLVITTILAGSLVFIALEIIRQVYLNIYIYPIIEEKFPSSF